MMYLLCYVVLEQLGSNLAKIILQCFYDAEKKTNPGVITYKT